MIPVVVDASALAAITFNGPEADAVRRRVLGATLFAPTLAGYEMSNIAWKKARRHPESAAATFRALAQLFEPRWGIAWRAVDHTDAALIAVNTGLSVYDASYLWLAGSLGAELVTLDARLARVSEALSHPAI
jgi:predicted nucleic acid-binding protein